MNKIRATTLRLRKTRGPRMTMENDHGQHICTVHYRGRLDTLRKISLAQTTPKEIDPTAPNPQAKPGATMVINPTENECQRGWNASLKWTKAQFEQFCALLKAAK